MTEEQTPKRQTTASISEADTIILPKVAQNKRSLRHIIDELNDSHFLSLRRYSLKKEFLERLRNRNITGNATVLLSYVLPAVQKYLSTDEVQEILVSALQFAVIKKYDLERIKLLVEVCKVPIDPVLISSAEDREIKLYLQEHTALYAAVQKKDLESFKIALKKGDVKLTEYVGLSIVDVIQSKIRENQDRNVVVRYFLNRKWNSMLRATTGQIKKQLLRDAKSTKSVSTALLSLLNQCPPEEIYSALHWYDHDHARLYNIFKKFDLREYLNIYLQLQVLEAEEAPFEMVRSSPFKVISQLPKVPKTFDLPPAVIPVAKEPEKDKAEAVASPEFSVKRALFK